MKLRRTRGRRAMAATTAVVVGAMTLTACDWTRVTQLESEGWHLVEGTAGESVSLVVAGRRSPIYEAISLEGQGATPARSGALRVDATHGDIDYAQTEHDGRLLSDFESVSYLVGTASGDPAEPTVALVEDPAVENQVPTLQIDIEEGEGSRTIVLDPELAAFPLAGFGDAPEAHASIEWSFIATTADDEHWYDEADPDAGHFSLGSLTDAAISTVDGEGIHLVVDRADPVENSFVGYVDALRFSTADMYEGDDPDALGWDFEVSSTGERVERSGVAGWTFGPGVELVEGPAADDEARAVLPEQDEDSAGLVGEGTTAMLGTDLLDGDLLGDLGTLRYRAHMSTAGDGFDGEYAAVEAYCSASPVVSLAVTRSYDGITEPDALLGHPCFGFGDLLGPAALAATSPEATIATPTDSDRTGVWLDFDATNFAFFSVEDVDLEAGALDEGAVPATLDAYAARHADAEEIRIASWDVGEVGLGLDVLPGFALHGPQTLQALMGGEAESAPSPVFVDEVTFGHLDAGETATYDFGPAPSGGGGGSWTPGYTITIPAGGGTGTVGLPVGTGSITVGGNTTVGTFTLVPGSEPAGTPRSLHVLGQSWDILPPVGFGFDTATVCLPYDEAALQAAGFDEDDLALVHYAADGTIEDITTSIDTDADTICGETDSFSPFVIGILDVDRLAGTDRVATAAAISAATFEPGAPVAYIATGDHFADALAGGAAAAHRDGPVLLVDRTAIPAATLAELERLQPAQIVVLGGTAAVSDAVLDGLGELTDGAVTRLAGLDRYGTAAAVSAATFDADPDVVYVATGQDFADALTGGAAAARDGAPVLLVSTASIPTAVEAELQRLSPDAIVVLGGTAAVSDDVVEALGAYAPVDRLSGSDRYETAAAIAETFTSPTASVFIASGQTFPDALTGVPAAGRAGSPILLVDGGLPAAVDAEVRRLDPGSMRILGGTEAVADALVTLLRDSMLD